MEENADEKAAAAAAGETPQQEGQHPFVAAPTMPPIWGCASPSFAIKFVVAAAQDNSLLELVALLDERRAQGRSARRFISSCFSCLRLKFAQNLGRNILK